MRLAVASVRASAPPPVEDVVWTSVHRTFPVRLAFTITPARVEIKGFIPARQLDRRYVQHRAYTWLWVIRWFIRGSYTPENGG